MAEILGQRAPRNGIPSRIPDEPGRRAGFASAPGI